MGLFKRNIVNENKICISCPIAGVVLPIEQTPDQLFAKKMMGDGVMIKPQNGSLYSPCNGIVEAVYPSKHAIGIRLEDQSALLIHFGLETVNLNGKGFDVFVKQGAKVKKGKLLLEADLDYIRANADNDCVIMVLSEVVNNKNLQIEYGTYRVGETIITMQ